MNKFIFLFFLFTLSVYPKTTNKLRAITLLDSVKIYYGDTCNVGIKSNLISSLYTYKRISVINNYLKQYEAIRKKIIEFRKAYYNNITNENGMILDISRIFKDKKLQNIANVCGIYFGPDSVTSIALSYIIVRSSVKSYFFSIIQLLNFDKTFKEELLQNGKDWFYSKKLIEIKGTPFK